MRAIPSSNLLAQAQNILESIQVLKHLEQEGRQPTPSERDVLMRFSGFGSISLQIFPDPMTQTYRSPRWQALGTELQSLLTPQEYASAKKSCFSQFLTSPLVVQSLYVALARLGLQETVTALEPGCAHGAFLAHMPAGWHCIGIEQETVSGRIARALYAPQHDIRIEDFQDTILPDNSIDAAIGNPPFGDVKLPYWDTALSLHEYFIAKSIDLLKPGGILAMVVTHFLLDRSAPHFRQQIAEYADFLGAIRLPSGALEGTKVVADVAFFHKRFPGQHPMHIDHQWTQTAPILLDGHEIRVNTFFQHHRHMLLGAYSYEDRLYGSQTGYSVAPTGDLATQLSEAIKHLPAGIFHATPSLPASVTTNGTTPHAPAIPQACTEGSFFVNPNTYAILQIQHAEAVPVLQGGKPLQADGSLLGKRLAHLIRLRDSARYVLDVQNTGQSPAVREQARQHLNAEYDAFMAIYGPINHTVISTTAKGITVRRMPNLVTFRDDPDAMLVMALEQYDETTGIATKAAIMEQDVVVHQAPITAVQTAEQGLLLSLDQTGRVDLGYIAQLTGKSLEEILDELGDLLYQDPDTQAWETADVYLSGNVRAKLARAEQAGASYQRNAEALRLVQPEDLLPGNIDVNLGAPWIPATDIHAFACEVFGLRDFHITVAYSAKDALWSIDGSHWASSTVAATAEYGTSRIDGIALLGQALNLQSPTIYNARWEQGKEVRTLDQKETLAAREKQQRIKQRFKEWIFSEPSRAERLVRVYNDLFNNLRLRTFDGAHLRFPGMSPHIQLAKHQVDAVWRIMSSGNTLLAHCVGAGKTWCMFAAAMKMKQAGLIHKPLCTVPNNLLEQFARECLHLYPNAKLLIATKEDFTQERRKLLTAKMASGAWDGILTTHSSFERIGMSREFQERFLQEEIQAYESLLVDAAEVREHERYNQAHRNIIKSLEKQKARYEAKLEVLAAKEKKDDGLVFDELGVDYLFVDECFTYDTLIETDKGVRKIGDIVEERLEIQVKSVDSSTFMIEYKPVTNWFVNRRHTPLIEVKHERGSFICTPQHRIWVDGYGYKMAASLSPQDMCLVSEAIHIQESGTGKSPQAHPPLLRQKMQSPCSESQSGKRGQMAGCYAGDVDQFPPQRTTITAQGETKPHTGSTAQSQQSYVQSRNQAQGKRVYEGTWAQATGRIRGWPENTTSTSIAGCTRHDALRVCYSDKAYSPSHEQPARPLQGRPCRSCPQTCCGSRRGKPCISQETCQRCKKRQGIIPSRVVSVTVLEPGSNGEYCVGGRTHPVVYDIEVAENHNYFANGVLVSNCQAYKNQATPTKMQRVAGIQTGGSERAFDLAMKVRYLEQRHPGHGIAFASGTPVSNSMVELYTLQRYLDASGLYEHGLEHFDAWAATFGEVIEAMEISPDGKTLRPRQRFARFVNLPDLLQQFRTFADVQTAAMLQLPTPALTGGKPAIIACPMSDVQRRLQDALVKRYEAVRNGHVKPWEDNALAITTDGRKLALEARLLLGTAEDEPASKVNALVENVCGIWHETEGRRGTQLVFADMGVHPTAWGYCVYDDVLDKLIKQGLPREQVAMIGDADSDGKKHALFEKVRAGSVRVLLGSTQKMGIGMDVQRRLVALHHLDAPWKPAEVEQREGRILRQGNLNAEVAIYRYVTEGSFDAFMWQALETKAKFIAQVITGDSTVRQAEDISEQALSYAEVKAIASGNPAVLTMAETEAALQRLAVLAKHHEDEQYVARVKVRDLPHLLAEHNQQLTRLQEDKRIVQAQGNIVTPFMLNGQPTAEADALASMTIQLQQLPPLVTTPIPVCLGTYLGLQVTLTLHPYALPEVSLTGQATVRAALTRRATGPRAILNAAQRLAGEYESRCLVLAQDIRVQERQLQDYTAQLGKPFPLADYREALDELRYQLSLALSEQPPASLPPIEALVAAITALQKTHALVLPTARPALSPAAVSPAEAITTRIYTGWRAVAPATAPEPLPLFGEMLLAQEHPQPARRAPRQRRKKTPQGQLGLFS